MTRQLDKRLLGGAFAVALVSASCAAILGVPVRRPSDDPIRVPHARHAAAKVECLSCHETVYDATELGAEGTLPPESKCLECHKEQKEKGNCGMCHTDVKRAGAWPKRDTKIIMSHAKHIERVKEDCTKCHKALPGDKANPLGALAPTMNDCRGCHEHDEQFKNGQCDVCHTDLAKYSRPVTSFSHSFNYVRDHARPARSAPDRCALCHEQTFCSDCHTRTTAPKIELKYPERVDRDFIHRNDFLGRHSVEAMGDPASCRRCHGESFCTTCHTAQNLTPGVRDPRNPHPVGWSFPTSANFHGPAARRDITSCAACHDQGPRSNCIECHKVGGIGGNPHPAGWSDRHGREEARTNSMCLYCHQ